MATKREPKPGLSVVPDKPARKRAPRRVTAEPAPEPTPTLLQAVDRALEQMTWLQPTDAALVEVTRKYAAIIESTDDSTELAKRVGWIGPQLINALKALGGAPAERKALGVEREAKGRLAELRAARGR